MKCSALEIWWIRSICNEKSWINAMGLFQSVAAALLQWFLTIRKTTFGGIEQYSKQFIYLQLLHTRWIISSCQHSWVTSWAHRVGRWSSIKTAEDEVSDEVFLPCWICQVFTLHYLLFDGNERQCWLCLMDIGVQLYQIGSVIKLPLELAKGCQKAYYDLLIWYW